MSLLGFSFVQCRLCFYALLNACRSNQLSAGMGWRADYHYSYIRTETHRGWPGVFLCLTGFGFLILAICFVLGMHARPWWGLPQSVAVGVVCPHLMFPELKCRSDL